MSVKAEARLIHTEVEGRMKADGFAVPYKTEDYDSAILKLLKYIQFLQSKGK